MDVSPDFAAHFPAIEPILTHLPSLELFRTADAEAQRCKTAYNALGITAITLSTLAVFGEVIAIGRYVADRESGHLLAIVSAVCGAGAIALVAFTWLRRFRSRWCESVFVRERIRQWRFQQCLNHQIVASSVEAKAVLIETEWDVMQQSMTIADGALRRYVNDLEGSRDLMVRRNSGSLEPAAADQVLAALGTLRVEYQAAFAAAKLTREDRASPLGIVDRITENVAVWAFAAAVVVTLFELITTAASPNSRSGLVSATIIGLLAVSAAVRALRSGLGLPELIESFSEYLAASSRMGVRFAETADIGERWGMLVDLEIAAAAELRRYLRAVLRSRYLL